MTHQKTAGNFYISLSRVNCAVVCGGSYFDGILGVIWRFDPQTVFLTHND